MTYCYLRHTAYEGDALPTELPRQLSWLGWIKAIGFNVHNRIKRQTLTQRCTRTYLQVDNVHKSTAETGSQQTALGRHVHDSRTDVELNLNSPSLQVEREGGECVWERSGGREGSVCVGEVEGGEREGGGREGGWSDCTGVLCINIHCGFMSHDPSVYYIVHLHVVVRAVVS